MFSLAVFISFKMNGSLFSLIPLPPFNLSAAAPQYFGKLRRVYSLLSKTPQIMD